MKTYFKTGRHLLSLLAALILAHASLAGAQDAFTHDPVGNLTSASPSAGGAPSFISPPEAELLQSNSVATFSAVATGPGLSYQWFSNGVAILGATGDSLILANLPLIGTNLGNFSVTVSNAYGSVSSTPVALWTDSNGNGIPDWWELHYFGNLNQPALGDYDGDGVDNLDEYLEGTDPTNPNSFDPRLNIQTANGIVTVSPDLPYFTMGQAVSLTATPDPGQEFVDWGGAVRGTKSTISLLMNTNESVTATFGFPLALALDNTNLVWTTTGDELWFGEAEVSEDGISAAQSGPIVSYYNTNLGTFVGDQTTLETTFYIEQPEQLGFWWDVSSQPPDGVTFAINGVVVAALSGPSVPWQQFQTNLPAGVFTLTWTYSKGPGDIPNGIPYTDAAWVDEVSLASAVPLPSAPTLSIQLTDNGVLISWPVPSVVFRLEETAALTPASWVAATNTVNLVSGMNQVLVDPVPTIQFYRLVYP
jgi:Divergent InlB B-repeat domain